MRPPTRELKIGTIIDKTLGVVERSAVPALLYLAVLTIINGALTYFSADRAPMQLMVIELVKFLVGIVLAYLLIEAMVRRTGLRARRQSEVFLPYFGLSILYTLGVMVGLLLVIIPGLLIMARWSIAQPMLVARGTGVTQALGESWERTRGNEFPILVAALALIILPIVVLIAAGMVFETGSAVGLGVSQLATSALSVVSLGMGVALFGLIMAGETAPAAPAE